MLDFLDSACRMPNTDCRLLMAVASAVAADTVMETLCRVCGPICQGHHRAGPWTLRLGKVVLSKVKSREAIAGTVTTCCSVAAMTPGSVA